MNEMDQYFVYIMTNLSGTLHTGVARDLKMTVYEHKGRTNPGSIRKNPSSRLVYYEVADDIVSAIARERQIKGWLRAKKVTLIESKNPEWRDLSDDWLN